MTSGWQPDPSGRHQYRYHDGTRWTEHVADDGVASTDPWQEPPPGPDPATASSAADPAGGWAAPTAPSTAGFAPPDPGAAVAGPSATGPSAAGQPWAAQGPPPRTGWSTTTRVVVALGALALLGVVAVGAFVAGMFVVRAETGTMDFELGLGAGGLEDAVPSGQTITAETRTVAGGVDDGPVSYDLLVRSATTVRVTVTDATFDTVLELYTADGGFVTEDDDGGRGNLSELVVGLDPGTYVLVVREFAGVSGPGTFSLDVAFG
jgi:hypothetical protein